MTLGNRLSKFTLNLTIGKSGEETIVNSRSAGGTREEFPMTCNHVYKSVKDNPTEKFWLTTCDMYLSKTNNSFLRILFRETPTGDDDVIGACNQWKQGIEQPQIICLVSMNKI